MKVFALDLWEDLREKRLWPVAAVLVIALVAVPVLLLKPASNQPGTSADAPPTAGAPTPTKDTVVAAVDRKGEGSDLEVFSSKDPFHRRVKEKAGAGTATLVVPEAPKSRAPAAPSAPADSGSKGSAGPGGTGSGSSPAPTTTPHAPTAKPKTKTTRYTYVVDVTFGRNGHLHRYRGLRRLSMLPNEASPLLISLGVDAKADNAVFIVDASVKAHGEGRCPPSGPDCVVLSLGAGSEEYFTQADGDSYMLRVDAIRKVTLAKAARASRAQARRAKRSARTSASTRLVPPVIADLEIVASSAERGSSRASQSR